MGIRSRLAGLNPFSEYPVTRRFADQKLPPSLCLLSVIAMISLVIWNVMSQGHDSHFSSILSEHYGEHSNCQPASLAVGQSFFTSPPRVGEKDEEASQFKPPSIGAFEWVIQSLGNGTEGADITQTAIQYTGNMLRCNLTRISLDFGFSLDSYTYTVRVMCSYHSLSESKNNYISLSSAYSLRNNVLPKFTEVTQVGLQAQVFRLITSYYQMEFPPNSLPGEMFPLPYGRATNRRAASAIPHKNVLEWSSWLDGFNYTPTAHYIPYDPHPADDDFSYSLQGKLYPSTNGGQQAYNFSEAFINMIAIPTSASGLQIAVSGIGGVRPIPTNWTFADIIKRVPPILPIYIRLTQSILAIIMDVAANDIDQRVLNTRYLCTVSTNPWKKVFPMLGMLAGSCVGTFSSILTIMIYLARRYDCQAPLNHGSEIESSSGEKSHSGRLQCDCTMECVEEGRSRDGSIR